METTKPKIFVFVLMPFSDDFDDVYQLGIKEACKECGVYCERVDEQIYTENMIERIYNQIAKADFLIADMSNRNPNVFYEVGYAHALGKNVILLTQNSKDIPFDFKHFPHIIYNNKITVLKEQLIPKVKFFTQNVGSVRQYSFPFKFYINGKELIKDMNLNIVLNGIEEKLVISFYNDSDVYFDRPFKISLTAYDGELLILPKWDKEDLPIIIDRKGVYMQMKPINKYFFPRDWNKTIFYLNYFALARLIVYDLELSIYTEYCVYKYPFKVSSGFQNLISGEIDVKAPF